MFGIIGMVGILSAPVAGRAADRRGADRVILIGAFAVLFSWIVFGGWISLPGLVIRTILLDLGV